jgi:hypothetical protein
MGAYSNPEETVDTQSGQYYRNLTDTIVSNTVGTINTWAAKAAENKKKNEAIAMKVGEEESALYRNLSSTQQQNPTVNFENLYRPQIKKYAELRTKVLNGTSADPSADRMEADKIFASVGNIKNSLVDLSSEDFDTKWAKRGVAGGISMDSDPNTVKALAIFYGKIPGKKEPRFENGKAGAFVWDVYEGETLVQTFSAEQLKKAASGQGLLRVIPNAADSVDAVKAANPDIFELKDGVPTGRLNEMYYSEVYEKPLPGEDVTISGKFERKTTKYMPTGKLNETALRENTNFNTVMTAKADGLINGTSNNIEAIMFHNTYLAGEDKNKIDPNYPMNEEQKEKFRSDYKEFIIKGLPKEQAVAGAKPIEKSEVGEMVIKTQPSGGTGGNNNTNKKLTAEQKKQNKINSIHAEVAALIKERDSKKVSDDELGFVENGNFRLGIKDGYWSVYNKTTGKAMPGTLGTTTPSELAIFLAGGKPTLN